MCIFPATGRCAIAPIWKAASPAASCGASRKRTYRNEQDIYQAVFELQWQRWFDVTHTIRVNTTAIRCPLKSLEFITLLVKDAVCDRFRAHCNERPSVDTLEPDMRIHVFIEDNKLMLYLDTSGDALFKRGVRSAHQHRAAARESRGGHSAPGEAGSPARRCSTRCAAAARS